MSLDKMTENTIKQADKQKQYNMEKNPLFSIVMPVYGVEKLLGNTIKSLLNQTFKDFELILVDDESPDNCPKMCDEYERLYPFVKTVHQKNKGQGGARNAGLSICSGEYVFFMDSDDIIQPETLEYYSSVIEKTEKVDAVFSDHQKVTIGDEFKKADVDNGVVIYSRTEMQNLFLLRKVRVLTPGSWCFRRELLLKHNIRFEEIRYSEDVLFVWDALLYANKVVRIRKTLYNYLVRPGSIMTSASLSKIESSYPYFKMLNERYIDSKDASPEVKRFLFPRWVLGILHSSARLCTYKEFRELCGLYEAKENCKKLRCFPDKRVVALSLLYSFSPLLFYIICGGGKMKK